MSCRPNGHIERIKMGDIQGARGVQEIYSQITVSSELAGDVFHGWQCLDHRDTALQPACRHSNGHPTTCLTFFPVSGDSAVDCRAG